MSTGESTKSPSPDAQQRYAIIPEDWRVFQPILPAGMLLGKSTIARWIFMLDPPVGGFWRSNQAPARGTYIPVVYPAQAGGRGDGRSDGRRPSAPDV